MGTSAFAHQLLGTICCERTSGDLPEFLLPAQRVGFVVLYLGLSGTSESNSTTPLCPLRVDGWRAWEASWPHPAGQPGPSQTLKRKWPELEGQVEGQS